MDQVKKISAKKCKHRLLELLLMIASLVDQENSKPYTRLEELLLYLGCSQICLTKSFCRSLPLLATTQELIDWNFIFLFKNKQWFAAEHCGQGEGGCARPFTEDERCDAFRRQQRGSFRPQTNR
jgi:hypothetical protein